MSSILNNKGEIKDKKSKYYEKKQGSEAWAIGHGPLEIAPIPQPPIPNPQSPIPNLFE